jgi:DNA excision repair protein ERCC-4
MSRAYEICILLIEFDPDKPFYLLQSRSASALRRVDISPSDVISKLVLLLLHHPKLKVLWTSGPKLTCEIFHDLKRNEPNPNSDFSAELSISEEANQYSLDLKVSCFKLFILMHLGYFAEITWN